MSTIVRASAADICPVGLQPSGGVAPTEGEVRIGQGARFDRHADRNTVIGNIEPTASLTTPEIVHQVAKGAGAGIRLAELQTSPELSGGGL